MTWKLKQLLQKPNTRSAKAPVIYNLSTKLEQPNKAWSSVFHLTTPNRLQNFSTCQKVKHTFHTVIDVQWRSIQILSVRLKCSQSHQNLSTPLGSVQHTSVNLTRVFQHFVTQAITQSRQTKLARKKKKRSGIAANLIRLCSTSVELNLSP